MRAVPPMRILLVEDNPADVRLTVEALREGRVANTLHVARDGVEAAAFLDEHHASAKRPDLILLDLNLPRKNGHELLREIKASESLKHIPVIVLTTSRSDEDLLRSYRLSANAVVAKPVGLDDFFHVVNLIEQFWLGTAMLSRP
jgi:chemotaxis family two-component system response regulator Rcp1